MHIPGEVKSTLLKRGKQSKEVLDSLKKNTTTTTNKRQDCFYSLHMLHTQT